MYELKINLEREPRFHYGQKLFVVRKANTKSYSEVCPVCKGERKVTIGGISDLLCPYCQVSNGRKATYISVQEFVVLECFVNEIKIKGDTTKNLCAGQEAPFPQIYISGFTRVGNGYGSVYSVRLDNPRYIDEVPKDRLFALPEDCVYTTKKGAEELKKMFIEYQKDELRKFNEEHGTNYEYPFE